MLENIRLAFGGIWSHKMRSMLTMLGIIIGIASIMAIVSMIKGSNELIKQNVLGSGKNTVNVQLTQGGYTWSPDGSTTKQYIPQVSDASIAEIEALPEVDSATAYVSRYVDGIFYKNEVLSDLMLYGIDEKYFSTCSYVVKTGRGFVPKDYSLYRTVMILDEVASRKLFGNENPLGKTVEVSSVPFTIVGIVKLYSTFQPDIETLEDYYTYAYTDSNGLAFIPKASWPILYRYDEPENVTVRASSTDDITKAGRKTATVLNNAIPSTDEQNPVKYNAEDLLGQAARQQQLNTATRSQLLWVAGIALIVGGVGVMNIMLVSVTERTAEIGLKKAIGARKSAILAQFLTEAAVLTTIGGILGVIFGYIAAYVAHRMSGMPIAVSWEASAVAVAFSMLIGIGFGFFPSVKAANKDPIEALRRD